MSKKPMFKDGERVVLRREAQRAKMHGRMSVYGRVNAVLPNNLLSVVHDPTTKDGNPSSPIQWHRDHWRKL